MATNGAFGSPANDSSTTSLPQNSPTTSTSRNARYRGSSGASASGGRLRSASLRFMESSLPSGMWAATGEAAAKAPSLAEIRRGSFGSNGWEEEGQRRESARRNSTTSQGERQLSRGDSGPKMPISPAASPLPAGTVDEIDNEDDGFPDIVFGRGEMSNQSYNRNSVRVKDSAINEDSDLDSLDPRPKRHSKNIKSMLGESPRVSTSTNPPSNEKAPVPNANGVYPNGYSFPPKHTWGQATLIGLTAFGKFSITPLGFFIVLYGLNVVAWGGMLFLLLCNASAPMCYSPYFYAGMDCNNINAPRRIWIEIDSQILNALFCVTGFGLIPWRFRDFYYLLKFRISKREDALRRLAGIHSSWFRLPGSQNLPIESVNANDESNPAVPLPTRKAPSPPLTGARAPPTPIWKLDYVIWLFVINTFLQAVLSGFMWGYNRYARPSWSTGTFVALACIVAAAAGLMQFLEGKKIKNVEGVPVEVALAVADVEAGVKEKRKAKGKTVA